MNRAHDCKHLREQLFDYRRAELSAIDAAQLEDELERCPDCAQRIGRLIGLLDLAAQAPAEDWLDEEAQPPGSDALFESISQRLAAIEAIQPAPQREVRLHGPLAALDAPVNDDEEDELAPPRRSLLPWIIAAACAALAIAAALSLAGSGPDAQAPTIAAAPDVAPAEDAPRADLAALEPAASAEQAVKIFASDGASWVMEREAQGYVVRLSGGTLLIEFLPGSGESLRVVTPDSQVEVVGTVFFVRAKVKQAQDAVGVLAGSVRVKRGADDATLIERGQAIEADGDVHPLDAEAFEQVRPHVDLDAHEAALRARADQPAPVEQHQAAPAEVLPQPDPVLKATPPTRPAPAPRVESVAQLRQRASDALAARQYAQAAQDFERLLSRTAATSPEAATLRLELARLYMRELNQRDQAAQHLRAFLKDHPDDVAAPSARRQLCRLLGPDAADPLCL